MIAKKFVDGRLLSCDRHAVRLITSAMALTALACLGGCTRTVQGLAATAGGAAGDAAAKTAPPVLVNELGELDKAENQQKLRKAAGSPAVQQVSQSLGSGLGKGMFDELVGLTTGAMAPDSPEGSPSTEPALASERESPPFVRQRIDPVVTDVVHTAIHEGVQTATDADAQAGARAMAEAMGDGAVRGAARAARDNAPLLNQFFSQQLSLLFNEASQQRFQAYVHDLLQKEVVPAVVQAWDQGAAHTLLIPVRPDIKPAVVENSHNLSLGASFGTHDAMIQLGVLAPNGGMTATGKFLLWGAVTVMALIGLAAATLPAVLAMIALALWRRPRKADGA